MATHYWPGRAITSLPYSETWDSSAWDTLPYPTVPPAPESDRYSRGWDPQLPGREGATLQPAVQISGGNTSVFQITGEGREVEFFLVGDYHGVLLDIFDFGTVTSGYVPVWKRGFGVPIDSGQGVTSAAVRAFLVSGTTYYFVVGSYGRATTPDPGTSGYGQVLSLSVRYAPATNNNLRDDATDVIIAANGQTYKSPRVLNAEYTQSVNATDDPQGTYSSVMATAWWRYVAEANTTFTAQSFITPVEFVDVTLNAWRMNDVGVLTKIADDTGNPNQITGSAAAAETIYFQIGVYVPNGRIPGQFYQLWITGGKTVLQGPVDPEDPDPEDPGEEFPDPDPIPWDSDNAPAPDKYDPDADSPAKDVKGSATLLELVREFSAAVKRAVRITDANTIEMVDPAVPLPAGFSNADAAGMYSVTMRSAAAEEKVLSVRAGDVKVQASAEVVSDDVRIVRSGWVIPGRLPVYGLPATQVKRITQTYSPTGYTASVDFHFPAVPIEARRI